MNLAELIQQRRGDRSYARLADAAGDTPKAARWSQLGDPDRPMPNAIDPPTVAGVARALYSSQRIVWLATGESLGLPVWENDLDDVASRFPSGLRRLKPRHWDVLVPLMAAMVEDADREDRLAELEAAAADAEATAARESATTAKPRRSRRTT